MPKVKPEPPETVYNEELGGVKVIVQLHDERKGVQVTITLPYPCAWRGRLVQRVQKLHTDERGRVAVMLPPSDELAPLHPRNKVPVLYKFACEPIGIAAIHVPNQAEWTLGEPIEGEKP